MDIETCIRNYLTSGEFNHEAYHPALDFLSGLLDITIVKPVIEFFTGTDLITGERLTEAQKYQKMAGAIVDMFTFGQGLVAMKGAGLVGKELCKAFGKTMLVEVASSASAYTVGYGVEAMGLPPQIAWMLGAATGCIVSTVGMNLVFRNPQTGVVRECSLEEITSLEKLDASEIDIAKLGKEVPTDDLELYMRYQKEGSIEHFTDSEKKTISRIETMGIKGDECEEILRARGREFNRPPREEPEVVLPPRNETSYGKSSGKYDTTADFLTNIENRNGKFYTDKATIDKIGQVEARGEDFSLLNKRIMSSRASTEGGTSVVYKYSDELGTKYLIHEVTDARGYIIHRDFDAVRISSGQLINKGH